MTLHETIVLFSWRTLQKYEVVEMSGWHKVVYPKGFIKTSRDIHETDKDREVLIIDDFTIYIGPKRKSNHNGCISVVRRIVMTMTGNHEQLATPLFKVSTPQVNQNSYT